MLAALPAMLIGWCVLVAPSHACPAGGGTCAVGEPAPAVLKIGAAVSSGVGNPINVMSGNKYQREEDMPALPGVLGLEVVRHYNSIDSGTQSVPGPLGRGWRLSYETRLWPMGNGLQLVQADGSVTNFSRDVLRPTLATSTNPAHGVITIRRMRGVDEYLWRWIDGRELSFDHSGKLMQIKAATGEILSLLYDAAGMLVKVTDPQGRSLRLVYRDRSPAAGGNQFRGIQRLDTPVGRFGYEYGSSMPKGATVDPRYLHASLVRVQMPDPGHARQYHYEDARHPTLLTGISVTGPDAAGQAASVRYATYGYNAAGKAILSTHARNADSITLDYARPGVTILTNSLGKTTTYRYSVTAEDYQLEEVRGAGCSTCGPANVRYHYDRAGRLTSTTELDALGAALRATRLELDYLGRTVRVSKVVFDGGSAATPQLVRRYEYAGASGDAPTLTVAPSVVPGKDTTVRVKYNERGQPLSITASGWRPAVGNLPASPIERTTRYSYRMVNGRSVLAAVDGPLPNGKLGTPVDSDITRIDYDASGSYPLRTVGPGGIVSEVRQRDAALRPLRTASSDGYRMIDIELTLAPSGQPLRRSATAWLLDRQQQPVDSSRQESAVQYRYDLLGNPGAAMATGGGLTRYRYDEAGQLTHIIEAERNQLARSYDSEGRLLAAARYGPDGGAGVLSYDAGHGADLRVNEQARTIDQQWVEDGKSMMLSNRLGAVDSVADQQIEQVIRQDGSVVRRWFDDFGRIVATRSPEHGLRTAHYSAVGGLLQLHDARGISVTLQRDAQDRVLDARYHDAAGKLQQRIDYSYQGLLLVQEERREHERLDSVTAFDYDAWGQPAGQRVSIFNQEGKVAAALPVQLVRDQDHRTLTKTLPSGTQVVYQHDASGRISGIAVGGSSVIGDVRYSPVPGGMRVTAMTFGNGRSSQSRFDQRGTLLRHENGVDSTSLDVDPVTGVTTLQRRPMPMAERPNRWSSYLQGLIGSAHAAAAEDAPVLRTVHYDTMQRLVGEARNGVTVFSARYNALGDRVGVPASRTDGAGNVLEHGRHTLFYNGGGELARVSGADGAVLASYRYDARGRRIAAQAGRATRYFLYEEGQLLAEAGADGKVRVEYIYLGRRPVARLLHDVAPGAGWLSAVTGSGKLEFLHADARDAVEAVSDTTGKLVWRGELDAFGLLRNEAGPRGYMPLRLSGQYADPETGLYYNVHRYYDPSAGRYLQADPLGVAAAPNMYAYVDSDPLRRSDPLGLAPEPDEGVPDPWMFGIFIHERFAAQVRALGAGWGANDGRQGTWTGLRPDAYHAVTNPAAKAGFAGNVWELKPLSWSEARNPINYATANAQVAAYVKNAKTGCWSAGSGKYLMNQLQVPGTTMIYQGSSYAVTYIPDPVDTTGLIFYGKVKMQEKERPATAPAPALAPQQRAELDRQMQQIKQQGAREGWSSLITTGLIVLLAVAIAILIAVALAPEVVIAGIIATIGAVLSAAAKGAVTLMAGLAAAFALGAAPAAAAETKGREKEQGLLDSTIGWFRSWF